MVSHVEMPKNPTANLLLVYFYSVGKALFDGFYEMKSIFKL